MCLSFICNCHTGSILSEILVFREVCRDKVEWRWTLGSSNCHNHSWSIGSLWSVRGAFNFAYFAISLRVPRWSAITEVAGWDVVITSSCSICGQITLLNATLVFTTWLHTPQQTMCICLPWVAQITTVPPAPNNGWRLSPLSNPSNELWLKIIAMPHNALSCFGIKTTFIFRAKKFRAKNGHDGFQMVSRSYS